MSRILALSSVWQLLQPRSELIRDLWAREKRSLFSHCAIPMAYQSLVGDLGPPVQTRVVTLQMGNLTIPRIGSLAAGRLGLKALQAMASVLLAPRRPLRSV